MPADCAGCCDVEDCPCIKSCNEERSCEKHFAERMKNMADYFGIRPGMTKEERRQQIERFRPPNV